ncbi:MAG TPA: hypothetical protein VFX31_03605, partial [Ktedonobacterales bacterium]|nr:hypothetical protein [Ktedonobacterales bacterium]
SFMADGATEAEAQHRAVKTFGDVRTLGRRLSAARLITWNKGRWARGVALGALLSWLIWTAGTFPLNLYYQTLYPIYTRGPGGTLTLIPIDPWSTFWLSTPPTSGAIFAYYTAGWAWVVPLVLLFMALPFAWGRRARHWWAPGLAYGLGVWLSMPWALFLWALPGASDAGFRAEAGMVIAALPLALLASLAGCIWRERRSHGVSVQQAVA